MKSSFNSSVATLKADYDSMNEGKIEELKKGMPALLVGDPVYGIIIKDYKSDLSLPDIK